MLLLRPYCLTMCSFLQQWPPALCSSYCWLHFCPYLVLEYWCEPTRYTWSCNDHLHVGDGKGHSISHIGHTMLRSPKCTFTLSNVLHVPHITKPLLHVQKFYRDNNFYFEFHASIFYVKDLTTKVVLLSDESNDSLYVLFESSTTTIPQAYWSPCIFVIADLWHCQLGHPTSCIFNLLVSKNKITYASRGSLVQCQASLSAWQVFAFIIVTYGS